MNAWDEFCRLNNTPEDLANADFDGEWMPPERAEKGKLWLEKRHKSLLLYGDAGRGKTYFMHALMRALISRFGIGCCRFFKSKNLDDRLLSELKDRGNADQLMAQVKEITWLFLDDFGMERSGERAEREYYDLIDDRVAHRLPMIISTNLTDDRIRSEYGDRIHSRLKTAISIHFDGEDLRGLL